MTKLWTSEELEVYIKYQRFNNLLYECFWVNLEDDEVELIKKNLHKQMLNINKPVKIYLDFKYIKTIKYSLMDFVKEELPDKLLTWIPVNFNTRQEMVKFLKNHIQRELQLN